MVDPWTVITTLAGVALIHVVTWLMIGRRFAGQEHEIRQLRDVRLVNVEDRLDGAAAARKEIYGEINSLRTEVASFDGHLEANAKGTQTRLDMVLRELGEIKASMKATELVAREAQRVADEVKVRCEERFRSVTGKDGNR